MTLEKEGATLGEIAEKLGMRKTTASSFNALIYLHRYTPDMVSIVLNEYLRELMTRIRTRIEHLERESNRADLGNAKKARNLKKIDKYTAQLTALEDYGQDILFPLAQAI